MVHERARVHNDENGVGQVGEDDDESSRWPVRRARANDLKASRLGGMSDTRQHRWFDQFGLKTGESVMSCGGVPEGLTGLASKPGETGLTGLGLKTGGGFGAVKVRAEDTWGVLVIRRRPYKWRGLLCHSHFLFLSIFSCDLRFRVCENFYRNGDPNLLLSSIVNI